MHNIEMFNGNNKNDVVSRSRVGYVCNKGKASVTPLSTEVPKH